MISCESSYNDIPKPFYVKINRFELKNDSSLGIEDAWVDVNGEFVGVFEVPVVFPVVSEKEAIISISPGVKVNGVNTTRTYYPFYKTYRQNIDISLTDTIEILPQTSYIDETVVCWYEGFESGHKFEKSNNSDTSFIITYNDKFKGISSGVVYLDSKKTFFESYTPKLSVSKFNSLLGAFLELNYKCNINFDIGLYIYSKGHITLLNLVSIYSSNVWKKIYIDLYTPLLKFEKDTFYSIYITAKHNEVSSKSFIFIDEFKVIQ